MPLTHARPEAELARRSPIAVYLRLLTRRAVLRATRLALPNIRLLLIMVVVSIICAGLPYRSNGDHVSMFETGTGSMGSGMGH